MDWIKYNPSQVHEDTFSMDDKSFRLYHLMIKCQFDNKIGFKIEKNDDEHLTKSGQSACKLMGISQRNAVKVSAILEALYEDFDGTLWHSLTYESICKTMQKSSMARDSVNRRWEKERQKIDTNVCDDANTDKTRIDKTRQELSTNVDSNAPPIKEKKAKVKKEDGKKAYGEFGNVRLTDDEHARLKIIWNDRLQDGIDKLDSYMEAVPKKKQEYKSHYAVLNQSNWVYGEVIKKAQAKKPFASTITDTWAGVESNPNASWD